MFRRRPAPAAPDRYLIDALGEVDQLCTSLAAHVTPPTVPPAPSPMTTACRATRGGIAPHPRWRRLLLVLLACSTVAGGAALALGAWQRRTAAAFTPTMSVLLERMRMAEVGRRALPPLAAPSSEALAGSYRRLLGACEAVPCIDDPVPAAALADRFGDVVDARGALRPGLALPAAGVPVARSPQEAAERLAAMPLTRGAFRDGDRAPTRDFLAVGRGARVTHRIDPAGLLVTGLLTGRPASRTDGYWDLALPRFSRAKAAWYAVLGEAALAADRGDWGYAEQLVRQSVGTGLVIADGASSLMESALGSTIAVTSLRHLADILAVTERVDDARLLLAALAAAERASESPSLAVVAAQTPLERFRGAVALAEAPDVPRAVVLEHVASSLLLATCADRPRAEYQGASLVAWREQIVQRLAGTPGAEAVARMAVASAPVDASLADRVRYCTRGPGRTLVAALGYDTPR